MNILQIDASILGAQSITRDLAAAVVQQLQAMHPEARLVYRDVVQQEIRHLTAAIAAGFRPSGVSAFDAATLQEHQLSELLLQEFMASDVIVVAAPMYNFSVPTQLKAWLDRLAQAGRSFQYTERGPVGLAGGKRVIVASARGGFYAEGPLAHMDFQEGYLRAFFGFLGIDDVRFVRAEGASKAAEIRAAGIAKAKSAINRSLGGL